MLRFEATGQEMRPPQRLAQPIRLGPLEGCRVEQEGTGYRVQGPGYSVQGIRWAIERAISQMSASAVLLVQVFGTKKSSDTRKALRFFAERRVKVHFVDLAERAASIGELRRFVQKFGVEALIDRSSRRFADLGLGPARFSDDRWLEKLADEPELLRIPLVRNQNALTIGEAEATWKEWVGK